MKPTLPLSAVLPIALLFSIQPPLAAAPDTAPLSDQLAAARDANDLDAQREIILRMLVDSPTDASLLSALATIQLRARENDRCADTIARLAAALGKPTAALHELRGDLANATAENDEQRVVAAGHWNAALKLHPEHLRVLHKLANYHTARGEYAQAAIHLKKLVGLRNHVADHTALARHAVRVRDWDSLITHTSKLRENFANLNDAKRWSPIYDRLMKQAAPLAALDARLDKNPNSIDALLERAWLFDTVGVDELASDDARRALKLQPESLVLRYQHAVILAHGGKAYEAERDYGILVNQYRYKRRVPPDGFFGKLLDLERRIAKAPDAEAHAERARLLLGEGQRDLARADAEAAVAVDPELAAAHLVLARVERAADHTVAAKASLARVLQLEPENTAALSELGYLQKNLGDFADAAATFGRYLEIQDSADIASARRDCLTSLQK